MELRAYWAIIWRRLWLIALVVGVVVLYIGYQFYHLRKTPGGLTAYHSSITFQIGLQATSKGTDPSYADNVVVSEALADTLVTGPILTSSEFDTQISHQIGLDMSQITQHYGSTADLGDWQNVGAIGGALTATNVHSLVTVNVTWPSLAGAWAVANAVGEVSTSSIGNYLNYVVPSNTSQPSIGTGVQPAVSAQIISQATPANAVPGTFAQKELTFVILLLVALIVGLALAFLVEYLDDRIHTKEEVRLLLQLPIYGEVPRAPTVGRSKADQRVKSAAT